MVRTTMLACLVFALCLAGLQAADEKAKVTAASLTVFKKLDPKDFPFQPGSVSMGILVSYPGKHVLSVDESSSISEFKDDKGTNLAGTGLGAKPRFNTYGTYNKDRSSLIVSAYGGTAPAAGATKVTLKGSLVLVCGSEPKTTKEVELEVKMNEEKKVDDFSVKITYVPPGAFGGPTLTVSSPKNNFKGLVLKDGDGKDLAVTASGNVFYNFATKQWNTSLYASKKPAKIKAAISYFNKDEKVTIPVAVTTGLSLE